MSAKPRLTVRLSPSMLHALAFIAERKGTTPAELARSYLDQVIDRTLLERVWRAQWQDAYDAWTAAQGARPGRAESPTQQDYDVLASGDGWSGATRTSVEPEPLGGSGDQWPALVPGAPPPPRDAAHNGQALDTAASFMGPDGRKRRRS